MEQRIISLNLGRDDFSIAVSVNPLLPARGVVVVVTRKYFSPTKRILNQIVIEIESGISFSACAREDVFDIRIGVPLALKRALRQIKGVKRAAIMREFFRAWPETHPQYRDKKVEEPRESTEELLKKMLNVRRSIHNSEAFCSRCKAFVKTTHNANS